MKRILLILLAVVLMVSATGCSEDKLYRVYYDGERDKYSNNLTEYPAGEKVKLRFTCDITETDYTFYVDGVQIFPDWDEDSYIIRFVMPDHDMTVKCNASHK